MRRLFWTADRANEVYRLTACRWSRPGCTVTAGFMRPSCGWEQRCRVVLLSNSYEETVREFLRQLALPERSARSAAVRTSPNGMIASLQALDPALLARPEALISIGEPRLQTI